MFSRASKSIRLTSQIKEITPDRVRIAHEVQSGELPNDAVIVCAGGILPTPLLKHIGIEVETKHGTE